MKTHILVFFILTFYLNSGAQMYGAQWVLCFNTSVVDFRQDSIKLDTIPSNMWTVDDDANICDSAGNLLYFTNGCYVAGIDGQQLLNGDSLNPCTYTSQYYFSGLNIAQASLFLPEPGSSRYYYLFGFSNDSADNLRPGTLFYSVIDKEGNSGLGAVIQKNSVAFHGILREGGMTACKHANGRDYWIILPAANNGYYKLLLTPNGILGPYQQFIGPAYAINEDLSYSKFSQDGSKYATSCIEGLVLVMDFDRCSGEFSHPATIFNYAGTISGQPISGAVSEEFSPNGRFLYVCNVTTLNQHDLSSDVIQDSVPLYLSDTSDYYGLHILQIAPNSRLYCSTYDGGLYALHVINYPDERGDSCKFVYGGQPTLTANSDVLPNMINYNLGSLVGSGCDTIRTGVGIGETQANNLLRVLPNPADKYLYVEMGMQGNYEFDLLNESGQLIEKKETRQVDNFDTENLVSGIYFLEVIDKANANMGITQKVIIQH